MRLIVEILTGTLFYIQVGDDATVADLKREIGSQEKLPNDRLIFMTLCDNQSRLIEEDGHFLVDYGIHDGSHIYLFFNSLDDGSTTHHHTDSAPSGSLPL